MDDLTAKIHSIVAESLDLEVDEVSDDSLLYADLDADSLDILDMNYQVRKAFGVEMAVAHIQRHFEQAGIRWLDDNGTVTAEGLAVLNDFMPELDDGRIAVGDRVENVFVVLKVGDLVALLQRALDENG
ncbi:MAG: phosphopantetheine-binding protein [Acidimicrobiaceae bacterium]|nr:phosphopantetheine-binding protein [Acidimicrobiaceae bacterium]MDE0607193.1 phosphopantetheine-binding protein [Acidimicrobiaceae bacterium]